VELEPLESVYVVCGIMDAARIKGAPATPKGLRHGFGIKAVVSGVPLNTLQQLLGHAQLSTTSIYADTMGPEKRELVERMCGKTPTAATCNLRVETESLFERYTVVSQYVLRLQSTFRCFHWVIGDPFPELNRILPVAIGSPLLNKNLFSYPLEPTVS
jgi:hypothetical protein